MLCITRVASRRSIRQRVRVMHSITYGTTNSTTANRTNIVPPSSPSPPARNFLPSCIPNPPHFESQNGTRHLFPRATPSNLVSPGRLATSAEPSPLLRNRLAHCKGRSNTKIPMSKEIRKQNLELRLPLRVFATEPLGVKFELPRITVPDTLSFSKTKRVQDSKWSPQPLLPTSYFLLPRSPAAQHRVTKHGRIRNISRTRSKSSNSLEVELNLRS